MINRQMRTYQYWDTIAKDGYGQYIHNTSAQNTKQVLMTINFISETVSTNSLYSDAQYVGLTSDSAITDKCVIQFGEEKLKVLYVNPFGRLFQVFLKRI